MKFLKNVSILTILMLSIFILMQNPVDAAVLTVSSEGSNYSSIQDAINNANTGDTILVYPGTYHENVDVGKQLTIMSTDGSEVTHVIAASADNHVFNVTADGVTIDGFYVSGFTGYSKAGIYLDSSNSTVTNVNAENNTWGIYLDSCRNNTLTNNNVTNNSYDGIILYYSSNNSLTNNIATNNKFGIRLYYSTNNTLTDNTAINSSSVGIDLFYSSDNILVKNTAKDNSDGIALFSSSDNSLVNNIAVDGLEDGICMDYSSNNNMLKGNTASNNANRGIWMYLSFYNKLVGNSVSNNGECGIYLYSCLDNLIYNNFFNNTVNRGFNEALYPTSNIWNINKTAGTNIVGGPYLGGNYWARPDGWGFSQRYEDIDGDGICNAIYDLSYTLGSDNKDYLPLASWSTGDVIDPVASFTASTTSGESPLYIEFDASSTINAAYYDWDFGDGNTSSGITTSHTFYGAGTYTVTFIAGTVNGTDTFTTIIDVYASSSSPTYTTPVADFSTNVTSGDSPLSVQFTDASIYATEWYWDFENDGITDSTSQNPIHTYTSDGIYTVKLTVMNGTESDTELKNNYINVNELSNIVLDFNPINDCSITIGESQDFYVSTNKVCTIEWYLNSNLIQTNSNVSSANFTFDSFSSNSSVSGTYIVKAVVTADNEVSEKKWVCSLYKRTLRTGQTWELKDGYTLTVDSIDVSGDKALLYLHKNGELVDQHIVKADSQYYYNRTLDGIDKMIIKLSILDIFQGQIDSLIVFGGIEQYPDTDTLDTNPTRLLSLEDEWNLGNNYSLKAVDIGSEEDSVVLFLNKSGITVDKRIMNDNDLYVYQRINNTNDNVESILEVQILKSFTSNSGDYVEFLSNYSLNQDTSTVDMTPFLLLQSVSHWTLSNGYSLNICEISTNNKAFIALEKEDSIVDYYIIEENSVFNYNRFDSINETIRSIITINSSKILDGKYEDYIEFNSEYQMNPDTNTTHFDDRNMLSVGDTFGLSDGYELNLVSIDIMGNKAFFNLTKNETLIDESVLKIREYYYYNKSINGNNLNIISFQLDNLFSGLSEKVAFIKDIIQNPDIATDTIYIENTEKEAIRIRGPLYAGANLDDIIGPNNTDFIEINALNFDGFVYDFDKGVSTEYLTIFGGSLSNGSTIYENGLIYTTQVMPIAYESNNLEGYYNIIGFFGDKYVPLKDNTPNKLANLLVNSNDKIVLNVGDTFELVNGYEVTAKQIDVDGDKVWMELSKNGEFIEDEVIDVSDKKGETWTYDTDIAGIDDVVVMKMNVTDIFQGYSNGIVIIEGLWLIDYEDILQLEIADEFGDLKISEIGYDYIKMANPNQIHLVNNTSIKFENNLSFNVVNDDYLRFFISVEPENTSLCEVRGAIADEDSLLTWTSLNFEGFCYDFNEGIQSEILELTQLSGRTIDDDDLIYTTIPVSVEFNYSDWGEFQVLGFMAEKYFAGYTANTDIDGVDAVSMLASGHLSKILIDDDEKKSVNVSSSLELEGGYLLNIVEVNDNGDSVFVTLEKDGDELDENVVSLDDDYVYKIKMGNEDVPIIAVHFNDAFTNDGVNGVFIEGLFQISDQYLTFTDGDCFGNMEITSYSADSIVMKNEDSILLSKGAVINITDNIKFRVADSSTVRYYPFVMGSTLSTDYEVITPEDDNESDAESSTTTSSSSGGSGGGSTTGEEYENILVKDVVSIFINKDSHINYEFTKEGNAITSVQFDSLKNSGKIQTIIEVLKDRSAFADVDAPGTIYQQMNIWVGKSGFVTPENVENLLITFKVEMSWLEENDIEASTVNLYRYAGGSWNALPTSVTEEDNEFVHFKASTPGFSPFAIVGNSVEKVVVEEEELKTTESSTENDSGEEDLSTEPKSTFSSLMMIGSLSILLIGGVAGYVIYRKRS